jgi:hypothetical protein
MRCKLCKRFEDGHNPRCPYKDISMGEEILAFNKDN